MDLLLFKKRIKKYLRSVMSETKLNSIAVERLKNDLKLDIIKIIIKFAKMMKKLHFLTDT